MMPGKIILTVSFPDFTLPLSDPVLVFALVLFIILLAPIILRKFRIPGIIGLILSGVAVGPYGFNLLERNDAIVLFGTVGLLYIMFVAGLELDMSEFRKNRNKSILFGFFSFSLPIAIGFPVCLYLLGYEVKSSLLIASMFATHTLVAYPIVSRLGISRNEAVAITVGGTIITDTLVLIILAIITGSVSGELNVQFWLRMGVSFAIFMFIVFYVFPPVARWFFRNVEAEKSSQYIFVLAMLFLAAFLANLAGLEAIIGAFMAGLALNRLIPHTSPLMNRIEFVGNALFIPFFLISVGMLVDLRILLEGYQAIAVAASLTVVALVGKYVAAYITQKAFGYSSVQKQIIFGLSSAHAAATLAVILVGYNIVIGETASGESIRLISEEVLNGTIILILITCMVSSFVTETYGRKLAVSETIRPSLPKASERILVPISNPATIETLIDLAILIKRKNTSDPISVLKVVNDDEEVQEKVKESNQMLEKAIIHAAATDTKVQVLVRVDLNVASGITRAVKELGATMVILGWSEKVKPIGKILGTTLDNLLASSSQMVWVCRIQQPLNVLKRIIIAAPVNAEFEKGFTIWVEKILQLAGQLNASVKVYCSDKTFEAFVQVQKTLKQTARIEHASNDFLYKFLTLAHEITSEDLFIVVSARKSTISHTSVLDEIPGKLMRYFKKHNFIIIYPEQVSHLLRESMISEEDLEAMPLEAGLEQMNRLGESLRRIFTNPERTDKR
ncbi:MAG: sodium:proton antiporter [Chitinophagales bacterium]|nr:MAG: sodium:proton antiporter [Chitinophagales bacterium]